MERLLVAAKELSEKVDSNETAAGDLLRQCESLQQELKAMKQVCTSKLSSSKVYGEPLRGTFHMSNKMTVVCRRKESDKSFLLLGPSTGLLCNL